MKYKNNTLLGAAIAGAALLAGCGGGTGADTGEPGTRLLATSVALPADATTTTFGVTQLANGFIRVDSGAGLVFNMGANGSINSIRYKGGPELQSSRASTHIGSGISATVTRTVANGIIKLTLTTPTLVHYILVKENDNTMYMGTYTTQNPSAGELRWITRFKGTEMTNTPLPANYIGQVGYAESEDVFRLPNGETRSKYYGNERAMDLTVRGSSGNGVGAYMVYGNRETAVGGPFFRDIQTQSGTDSEVYNYMNSGHAQTEPWRLGFHGPYALVFTDGPAPAALPDMGWMGSQGLTGWVGPEGRGTVAGTGVTGRDPSQPYIVGFANTAAQYWGKVDETGIFSVPSIKAGTYTMSIYRNELAVYTQQVTVDAGGTTTLPVIDITADPSTAPALWRIGNWDGTPLEFLNGDKISLMHPSDVRMSSWTMPDFVVGSTPVSSFPAAEFRTVNHPFNLRFNLRASQIAARKVRIGITAAYAGGRPSIIVNGWSSTTPAASSQPDSRIFTIGSYRGRNTMFTYNVPASAFVAGTNNLQIRVQSGSAGTGYLSPSYTFDAIDLIP